MRMTTTPPLAPAISVVMPMYNVEKYIGACLESILKQTFQDFEVVVVDNGSTDNSPAILESYIPKFGGRLKTFRIEKNSGSPSPAYNKAVALSRGKYVYVIDSDDLIVKNALEILYNYAEKSNADVVSMNKYIGWKIDTPFSKIESIKTVNKNILSESPVFEPENMEERVQKIYADMCGRVPWLKFVLRDLIIENNILFPENSRIMHDTVFSVQMLCCAKKILTIQEPLYIYRALPNSVSRKKRSAEENIPALMKCMIDVLNCMEDFLDKQKFFKENPQYHFLLMNYFARRGFEDLQWQTPQIPADYKFYDILKHALKEEFWNSGKTLYYFFTALNFSRLREIAFSQRVIELENRLKQLQGG